MNYPTYLVHFNPNHDPKNGKFTFKKLGSIFTTRKNKKDRSGEDFDGVYTKTTSVSNKNKDRSGEDFDGVYTKTTTASTEKKGPESFKSAKLNNDYKKVKAGIIITAAGLATAAAVGAAYCISERNEKIRHEQNQQRAREWIEKVNQVKWREAASKAKSIGGDW